MWMCSNFLPNKLHLSSSSMPFFTNERSIIKQMHTHTEFIVDLCKNRLQCVWFLVFYTNIQKHILKHIYCLKSDVIEMSDWWREFVQVSMCTLYNAFGGHRHRRASSRELNETNKLTLISLPFYCFYVRSVSSRLVASRHVALVL